MEDGMRMGKIMTSIYPAHPCKVFQKNIICHKNRTKNNCRNKEVEIEACRLTGIGRRFFVSELSIRFLSKIFTDIIGNAIDDYSC